MYPGRVEPHIDSGTGALVNIYRTSEPRYYGREIDLIWITDGRSCRPTSSSDFAKREEVHGLGCFTEDVYEGHSSSGGDGSSCPWRNG